MSHEFNSGVNKVRFSCATTDKKHGSRWALGTNKEWIEIRTTKAGKIKVITQKIGSQSGWIVNSHNLNQEGVWISRKESA